MGFKYLLTPSYVAGNAFSPCLIEALLFQTFFGRPDLVKVIRLLAGFKTRESYELDFKLNVASGQLAVIDVPFDALQSADKSTFGYLFLYLLQNFNMLALGVVHPANSNKALENDFPFVYTNPLPETPVELRDKLFVLTCREVSAVTV